MNHIKIKRIEYFIYIKVLIALGIMPFIFSLFFKVYYLFPHEIGTQPTFLIHFRGVVNILEFIGIAIATAVILRKSEKRKGCNDPFWLFMGFYFGVIAFCCYIIWGLYKEYKLIVSDNDEVLTLQQMIFNLFTETKK